MSGHIAFADIPKILHQLATFPSYDRLQYHRYCVSFRQYAHTELQGVHRFFQKSRNYLKILGVRRVT